jgi:hypothetical protein
MEESKSLQKKPIRAATKEINVSKEFSMFCVNFKEPYVKRALWRCIEQVKQNLGSQIELQGEFCSFYFHKDKVGIQRKEQYNRMVRDMRTISQTVVLSEPGADFEDEHTIDYPLIGVAEYKRGKIRIDVSKPYVEKMANLGSRYGKLQIVGAMSLTGGYAQRWYEILIQYLPLNGPNKYLIKGWSKEYIMSMLSVDEDKYSRNNDFIKKCITEPFKEICSKTNLHASWESSDGKKRGIEEFDILVQSAQSQEKTHFLENSRGKYREMLADKVDVTTWVNEMIVKYSMGENTIEKLSSHEMITWQVYLTDLKIDGVLQKIANGEDLEDSDIKIMKSRGDYMRGVIFNQYDQLKKAGEIR